MQTKTVSINFSFEIPADSIVARNADQPRGILLDMIAEFISARSRYGVDEYVSRRYDGHPESFKAKKLVEVTARVELAQAMRDAMFNQWEAVTIDKPADEP